MSEKRMALLHELVAIHVFGWRWMSYLGVPVRGTEGYPEKTAVRQLFSPMTLLDSDWQANCTPACGDEPLGYCYCSSAGPPILPTDFDETKVINEMRKLGKSNQALWQSFCDALPPAQEIKPGSLLKAALTAVGCDLDSPRFLVPAAASNDKETE